MNINLTSEQRDYIIGKLAGTVWTRQNKFGNACRISFKMWQADKASRIYINVDKDNTYLDANDPADLTIGFKNSSDTEVVLALINEQMSITDAEREEIRQAMQDEARASFSYGM